MEIPLTRPFLPPLEEYTALLSRTWENRRLTNDGPLHAELEARLAVHLEVPCVSLYSSGTLALVAALKVLGLRGEVVTTPFTSVATANAIVWNGLKPVFADISADSLNLDPLSAAAAVTPDTAAFLPVHLFGYPCDTAGFERLSGEFGLRTVYDATHCFGVKVNGRSLLCSGDLSVLSFHATKVFHTFEGGAVICHDPGLKQELDHLRNNGLTPGYGLSMPGFNAKLNEVQAAMGLLQLKYNGEVTESRREVFHRYRRLLEGLPGIRLPQEMPGVTHNYSYFPVLIDPEITGTSRDKVYERLAAKKVSTRKYFSPLITDYPDYIPFRTQPCPMAEQAASQVLCLPLFPGIMATEQEFIVKEIKNAVAQSY